MASSSELQRRLREAQRKAQRQVDEINRANQRAVDDYNRKARQHNQRVISDYNRHVNSVNSHNAQTFNRLIGQLNAASQRPRITYTMQERQLIDRIQEAALHVDNREYDVFLSYARLDGAAVAHELRDSLNRLGVSVWHDELAIRPGKSMSLQMDYGLRKARAGIALLTASYLAGRFWTERELGALLHKETLIPVLHGVTFADVKEYSGILPDLAGFTTDDDSIDMIAAKIAEAAQGGIAA